MGKKRITGWSEPMYGVSHLSWNTPIINTITVTNYGDFSTVKLMRGISALDKRAFFGEDHENKAKHWGEQMALELSPVNIIKKYR